RATTAGSRSTGMCHQSATLSITRSISSSVEPAKSARSRRNASIVMASSSLPGDSRHTVTTVRLDVAPLAVLFVPRLPGAGVPVFERGLVGLDDHAEDVVPRDPAIVVQERPDHPIHERQAKATRIDGLHLPDVAAEGAHRLLQADDQFPAGFNRM